MIKKIQPIYTVIDLLDNFTRSNLPIIQLIVLAIRKIVTIYHNPNKTPYKKVDGDGNCWLKPCTLHCLPGLLD